MAKTFQWREVLASLTHPCWQCQDSQPLFVGSSCNEAPAWETGVITSRQQPLDNGETMSYDRPMIQCMTYDGIVRVAGRLTAFLGNLSTMDVQGTKNFRVWLESESAKAGMTRVGSSDRLKRLNWVGYLKSWVVGPGNKTKIGWNYAYLFLTIIFS